MTLAPDLKKERYVIYVSPEVGKALRDEKAKDRSVTFSSIAEQAIRTQLKRQTRKAVAAAG